MKQSLRRSGLLPNYKPNNLECLFRGHQMLKTEHEYPMLDSKFVYCPRCSVVWEAPYNMPLTLAHQIVKRDSHEFGWLRLALILCVTLSIASTMVLVLQLIF